MNTNFHVSRTPGSKMFFNILDIFRTASPVSRVESNTESGHYTSGISEADSNLL